MLAMQFQLEQSQWWTPAEMLRHQFVQLTQVLAHASTTVPYYRERLPAAGYQPQGELSLDVFRRVPLLTRTDIQAAGPALLSLAVPAGHGRSVRGSTSGSTGTPIQHWSTDLAAFFVQAFTMRDHLWHGRDLQGKLLAIRFVPAPVTHGGWFVSEQGESFFETGPSIGVPIHTSVSAQIDQILAHQPDYLQGHASNLRELALQWRERGLPRPNLREVRSFAEVLAPDTRELVREVLAPLVTDVYSAQECGCLALQCPQHEHYHVQSESAYVEILRDDGEPCVPGEIGRVVITTLHNFAMPLIRYDIGDYAEVGSPCDCGRGLPVLTRILGRVRNMMALPSGDKRWPFIGSGYRQLAPVRQFQVIQKTIRQVELRLVVERTLTLEEEAKVRAYALERLGHAFDLTVAYCEEIPRSAGGKFEDFKSEVAV